MLVSLSVSFEFESTNFSYPIIRTVVSANEILHLQQIVENLRYTLYDSLGWVWTHRMNKLSDSESDVHGQHRFITKMHTIFPK